MTTYLSKPQEVRAFKYDGGRVGGNLPWRAMEYGVIGDRSAVHLQCESSDAWVAQGEWIVEFPSGRIEIYEDDNAFNDAIEISK